MMPSSRASRVATSAKLPLAGISTGTPPTIWSVARMYVSDAAWFGIPKTPNSLVQHEMPMSGFIKGLIIP